MKSAPFTLVYLAIMTSICIVFAIRTFLDPLVGKGFMLIMIVLAVLGLLALHELAGLLGRYTALEEDFGGKK